MKPTFNISVRTFLGSACLALFLVFVLASGLTIRSVTSISALSGKLRGEQLPLIVESQRAFVNVEGLRRLAEVSYLSGDKEARRKVGIRAQGLAAESLYFEDQDFHAKALLAAKDISKLIALRDSSEDHARLMRAQAGRFERELLQTVSHVSDFEIKSFFQSFRKTSMYTTGGLDLVPSAAETLSAQREDDAGLIGGIIAGCELRSANNPVLAQSCARLASHYEAYDAARNSLLDDLAASHAQWEQIDLAVREMRDAIGSGSERASLKALSDIEELSAAAVRNSLFFGVVSLTAFLFFLLLLHLNVLVPLRLNAQKLEKIRTGNLDLELPPFILSEISAISELLASFSEYLSDLYEQRDRLKMDSVQMRNLEQTMRAVFKASVDGYCVWSPTEIRLINKQMLALIGLDPDEVPTSSFKRPEDLPFYRSNNLYERVIAAGLLREEQCIEDANGDPLPVEVTSLPVKLSDGMYVLSYFRDLREQKELERNLREAKDKAEAGAEAKSAFLARMGHEIRTPLNGVLGLTQVALKQTSPEEQKRYLERIASSALILLQVIKDILDFSNMGSSGYKLENNIFSMREMLSTVADNIAPPAHRKGLEFKVYIDQAMPDAFYCDNLRMAQVLINLCDNAVKFTESGTVTLHVHHSMGRVAGMPEAARQTLKFAELPDGNEAAQLKFCELRFVVSDTGVGIPQEKLEEIFLPFSQVDASSTRAYGGIGLGLPISRQLVRMMGGELTVMSAVGQGSTFSFTLILPVIENGLPAPGASKAAIPASSGPSGANKNILPPLLSAQDRTLEPDDAPSAPSVPDAPGVTGTPSASSALGAPGASGALGASGAPAASVAEASALSSSSAASYAAAVSGIAGPVATVGGKNAAARDILRERRALLVEDNPLNQEIALLLLEDVGMSVLVADNGVAALDCLDRNDVDIVLMDIQMPVMDGITATSRIRKHGREQVRRLPVLAVTAQSLPEEREKCYAAGMNDHISKPLDAEELYTKMALWIGRSEGWQG